AERMREFGAFRSIVSERVPEAYILPPGLDPIVDLLRLHGAELTSLEAPASLRLERFVIDSTRTEPREFQGHRERELFGRWEPATVEVQAGSWRVTTRQPLGRLVFALLEPR